MASIKLTIELRNKIRKALMERTYPERKAAVASMENELAFAVYCHVYTEKERKIMNAMGKKFFSYKAHIGVRFGAGSYSYEVLDFQESLPFGSSHYYTGAFASFEGQEDHPIAKMYGDWKKAKDALKEELEKLEAEANSVLNSCNTVKQLCTAWPEIQPLLENMGVRGQENKIMLPAVRHDINEAFKLPPEFKE